MAIVAYLLGADASIRQSIQSYDNYTQAIISMYTMSAHL
jgi:hypothetical protein